MHNIQHIVGTQKLGALFNWTDSVTTPESRDPVADYMCISLLDKIPQLNNRNVSSHSSEGWKSKTKVLKEVPEASVLGLSTATF